MTLRIEDCRRALQVRFKVTKAEMLGPRRLRRIARPRQMAMVLARELVPNASTTKIGAMFNRDHTTVVHATRMMGALEEADDAFAIDMAAMRLTLATYAAQQAVRAMEAG